MSLRAGQEAEPETKPKTELLAPAKNLKIALSAINSGADAVYIGASSFGARKNAPNSLEDIKSLVSYAHKFYVKVYVTVNTIIADSELDDVKKLIKNLYDIGVDALIIQDMAIIKMAIEGEIPQIPIHISTQCDNRLKDKIKFFSDIGASRVILARELSLDDIKDITKSFPNLEIETFIHGALCVSYSGQCYMSCFVGGRSANRGECAQPCRMKYSLIDEDGKFLAKNKYLLSLKDFNCSNLINELVYAGVHSYKIEGRLKDEFYVKNVVGYYRNLLDKYSKKTSSGTINLGFEADLNKSFNRDATDYFLKKRGECFNFDTPKFIGEKIGVVENVDKKSFTLNLKKDIKLSAQDGLCFDKCAKIGCLVNRVKKDKIIYPNTMPKIKAGDSVYRNIDTQFIKSVLGAKTERKIKTTLRYENYTLYAVDEDKNKVEIPISERENAENPDKIKDNFMKSLNKTGNCDFYIETLDIISELPFIQVSKINEYRRILFDKLMAERISNYKRMIQTPLKYTKYYLSKLDYRANVHNKLAEEFYNSCGANVDEKSFESKKPMRKVELMRTKHCIKYAINLCGSPKKLFLLDDKGRKFPLEFDCKNCEMVILTP